MSAELLQQIATNTTPAKTTMISVHSSKPEFGINFPNPISVSEIALAKLSAYHSCPNIRSTPFGGLQPDNSFVFSYKNKTDSDELDWDTVALPTGSYQIDEINDEIQRQIKRISGIESKIVITAHVPTLSATIEISAPGYAVDIYNSSIRTVLGWPEEKLVEKLRPEPKKSDFMSNKKSYHEWNPFWKDKRDSFRYTSYTGVFFYSHRVKEEKPQMWWTFAYYKEGKYFPNLLSHPSYIPHDPNEPYKEGDMFSLRRVISFFNDMKKDFSDQLSILRKKMQEYTTDPSKVVKQVEILNQIIDNIEAFNNLLILRVKVSDDKQKFLDHFKKTEDQLTGYGLNDMDTDVMRADIKKIIDENFDDILTAYK